MVDTVRFQPTASLAAFVQPAESRAGQRIERLRAGMPLPAHLHNAVIALGNFDGFHLGHQAVARRAVEIARAQGGVATIVGTFDPHPVDQFRPGGAPFRLTTLDQRQSLLAAEGVDAMMVFPFDAALAQATPEGFVEHWLRDLGGIVTGEDFRFGAGRAGDIEKLAALGARRGITTASVAPVLVDGDVVSSSRIRGAIGAGDCSGAAQLMTRPFAIDAILRPGRRMDPALALIDASVDLGRYLRPHAGVYAVRARLADGRSLGGSAYLAHWDAHAQDATLELFLVDLAQADFGQRVEIELIARLHDACETYDPPSLRQRIALDRTEARAIVASLLH